MTHTTKLIAIGNSLAVVLPDEVLAKLGLREGDLLEACESSGGIELRPFDANLLQQMQSAEAVMQENRDVLRKLGET